MNIIVMHLLAPLSNDLTSIGGAQQLLVKNWLRVSKEQQSKVKLLVVDRRCWLHTYNNMCLSSYFECVAILCVA